MADAGVERETVRAPRRGWCGRSERGERGGGSSRQYSRQRITRVNLRDFIFYMEQERETSRSLLLYRALLK
ncbi:Transcription initiation factor TFIID subunit 4 [Anabarilius grahami]|uniref:Transcription initiation factor TFIID subunit 4 n=1 Tax=Anabarilius grahami TaxID=495550 RepID=A0A3N0Y7G9_ANAGA|nr:Transcription initiation factor TFIID subunit 4 [Anabarilius grahami]